MFTRIKIYNATDTSVEYDNLNNDFGIGSGSLYLNRRIATQDLEFGQFNSALFQCTVFGFEDDIQGRHIVVSQIDDNDVETNRFNGIIDSAKRDRLGSDRTISAYDWMYYHRDDNMAAFWNNYWSNIQDSTIVNFRNALLTYLGVPNNPATLPNDSVVIKNAFIDQSVTKLPLNGLMKTLCTVSGAFVYIDENGYLTFKTLSSTTVADLTGKVEGQNSEWEDYITKQITGIGIYDTSNNLAQLVGTSDNVYNIVGNYFFLSMDATQLTSVCNTLLISLQGVQYVPAKLALKLPEDLSLGDYVQTDNGNTYVFSIELSGVTFINQKIESSASGDTLPQTVEFEEDTLIQGAKISRLQKDIDGLDSEFRDLETEIGENYYTKTQTDSAISQSATQIKTEVTEEVTEAVLEQVGGQADNLIPYPYAFDSQEINGLTFTVSDVDGSITVDGTATDDTDFIIIDITRTDYNTVTLSKLDYVISGCPEDGSLNTYYLAVSQLNGTSVVDIARDYGHEIVGGLSNKFTVTDDESPIGCYIHVASGTTVEDIVFKPQLEYGQVKHEYQYTTTSKTSKIDQHSDEIVLKVDVNGKIVEANLSAHPSTGSEFKVSADNIDFIANGTMNLTANNLGISSTNFTLDTDGNVTATGTVTATTFMFWDTLQAYSSYGQYTYDLAKINWQGADEVWMSIKRPYGQGGTEAIRLNGPTQTSDYAGELYGEWCADKMCAKSTGSSWNVANDNAAFKTDSYTNTGSLFPVLAWRTNAGYWSLGSLGNNASAVFNFVTNNNYGVTNRGKHFYLRTPVDDTDQSFDILHSGVDVVTRTGYTTNLLNDVDLSKANNNVTADRSSWFRIQDVATRYICFTGANISPNGTVSGYLATRNYTTGGGSNTQNSISLNITKAGVATVGLSHPAAWRTALGLDTMLPGNYRIRCWTQVNNWGTSQTITPFTHTTLAAKFGVTSCTGANTFLYCIIGDAASTSWYPTWCYYSGGNWRVTLNKAPSSANTRLTFFGIYFG